MKTVNYSRIIWLLDVIMHGYKININWKLPNRSTLSYIDYLISIITNIRVEDRL